MLRHLLLVALTMAASATLTACGSTSAPEDARLRVVATIAPVGALAQAVAGDAVSLHVIAGAGVDPHEYQLKTADARAIANAQLILRNGLGADAFLDKALSNSRGSVVTLTDTLTLREGPSGDGAAGRDPHVWHDPRNDIVMVDVIVKTLADADPAHAATFEANGRAYQERLRQTDREVQALIDGIPPANRKMVTDHEAFGYFAARYGLTVVGTVIPGVTTASEPSAASVAALIQTIRREGVRAVFAEGSVDPKVARRIAEEANVRIVDDLYGDSLGAPGSGADTIEGMLLSNARKIADALR